MLVYSTANHRQRQASDGRNNQPSTSRNPSVEFANNNEERVSILPGSTNDLSRYDFRGK